MNTAKQKTFALLFLFLFCHLVMINPVFAALQSTPDEELLEKAESNYYDGDFENAIKFANKYLSQANLNKENKENAYILLVHIFLAKNDAPSATKVVESILNIDPEYMPTLEQETPKFVTFVSEVHKQYLAKKVTPKKEKTDWVLWGGAGAAATLLLILVASGGDEGGSKAKPLSLPPDLPE
jgi:hypothetical protein